MAPLRGVTVADFRRLFAEHFSGIDYAVAPFIPLVSAGTSGILPKMLKDVLPENCGRLKTVPQVIGKDPAQLRDMAAALRDLGYTELNLNCGCPWKFVAKKGRGSGLPENEANFRAMLEAGCDAAPGGFSIKIRLGVNDTGTLAARAALINAFPLKELIIHPRTGIQMYEGEVYVDEFAAVLPAFNMPVVYNGDVKTVADYARIVECFPSVNGVMLGRFLVADPTLAERIKAWESRGRSDVSDADEAHDLVRIADFVALLYAQYKSTLFGPASILGRMKELWGYTHMYFPNGTEILRAVQRCNSLEAYDAIVAGLCHARA